MKDAKDKEGRSVKTIGRAGIKYIDKDKKYFIDSEMLINDDSDLVIFSNSVRYFNDTYKDNPIPHDEKSEVIRMVIKLLLSVQIKVIEQA